MNYKLEKFWNLPAPSVFKLLILMNYKLEKFWNVGGNIVDYKEYRWTINLKSFEINNDGLKFDVDVKMNYKLEKFWNIFFLVIRLFFITMNYKLEKFWNY